MRALWVNFLNFSAFLGERVLAFLTMCGEICLFFTQILWLIFKPPYRWQHLLAQAEFVGVGSLFIVGLTGVFTGGVFTLQSVHALKRVGLESTVGATVLVSVLRELGPVLTSLMVTGRVGSAMATELGTMRVTEQIDALEVLALNPLHYLIVPRVLAAAIMTPILVILFNLIAFLGSYVVAVYMLMIDEGAYIGRIRWFVDPYDLWHGLLKSVVFGLVIALIGCYKGFTAAGGARGVGIATTQAVVLSSISIFILDYLLSAILLAFH